MTRTLLEVRGGDAGLVAHSDERGIAERTGGHAPQERVNRRFQEGTCYIYLN